MTLLQKIRLAGIFSFSISCAIGQNKEKATLNTYVPFTQINLCENNNTPKGSLPFGNITVLDGRFDTSSVGYWADSLRRIAFNTTASAEIEKYIKDSYILAPKSDSGFGLVILLEKLWLSASYEPVSMDSKNLQPAQVGVSGGSASEAAEGESLLHTTIIIKAKILSKQNNLYHPYYQVDTICLYSQDLDKHGLIDAFKSTFDNILTKCVNRSVADLRISKKTLTENDIAVYINSNKSVPILTTTQYKKGVFKTLEEFRNNEPSITSFEFKKSKKETERLFVTEQESSYPLDVFFAYCDGNNLFLNKANQYFRLFKEDNTFFFIGYNTVVEKKEPRTLGKIMRHSWAAMPLGLLAAYGVSSLFSMRNDSASPNLLQLDLNTGNTY